MVDYCKYKRRMLNEAASKLCERVNRAMLRCGSITARLLVILLIARAVALPASLPWTPGRRALGSGPGVAGMSPKEQAAAASSFTNPFMTLKPYLPTKPVNPFTPAFVPNPEIFMDKKAELLNNLFSSPMMGGGASGAGGEIGTGKAWSVGPGGPWALPSKRALGPWGAAVTPSPWAVTPVVDPSMLIGKKADFLSKLFSELEISASKPTGTALVPPFVPPGFWMPLPQTTPAPIIDLTTEAKTKILAQLLQALETPTVPATPPILLASTPTTSSPKIVPPSYWIPSSPLDGPGTYMKKVSDYLDKLFASLNVTAAATEGPVQTRSLVARHHNDNDDWRQQEWVRAVTSDPANPLATKDLVVNSILSEVTALKSAMLDTLNEMIAKQKEMAAVAASTTKKPMKFGPFPWGPTPKPTPPDPTEPYQKRLEMLGQVFDMLTTLGQEVATGGSSSPTASPAASSNLTSTSLAAMSRVARGLAAQAASSPLRSVQMAVHQGYQSMPAGTEELISAGAGRDPGTAHEGGGLNLKIKIPQ